MSRQRTLAVAGGVVVLLIAALAGAVFLYGQFLFGQTYESGYTYEATVAANGTLDAATLYLPVPADANGSTRLADVAVENAGAPPNASSPTWRVVNTSRGPMLAITVDRFAVRTRYYEFVEYENGTGKRVPINESQYDPSNPNQVAFTERSATIRASVTANRSVDTSSPLGSEPVFTPSGPYTAANCGIVPDGSCYTYPTDVYASYDAAADTRVYLHTEIVGANEWWTGGWNYNEYRDAVDARLFGPQDGWVTVDGRLETGMGNAREPPAGEEFVALPRLGEEFVALPPVAVTPALAN